MVGRERWCSICWWGAVISGRPPVFISREILSSSPDTSTWEYEIAKQVELWSTTHHRRWRGLGGAQCFEEAIARLPHKMGRKFEIGDWLLLLWFVTAGAGDPSERVVRRAVRWQSKRLLKSEANRASGQYLSAGERIAGTGLSCCYPCVFFFCRSFRFFCFWFCSRPEPHLWGYSIRSQISFAPFCLTSARWG